MRFSIVIALAAGLLGGVAHAQAPASAEAAARVDGAFARWSSRETAGCAVAVGRNGETVLSRAYGMADLEHDAANSPETVFEAGSVAKQFTAAAVVLLAQRGRLSLDDPVRRYVPELPDHGTPIRIRHVLNHTSGLRDWGTVQEVAGWPRGTRTYTHAHVLDIVGRQRALNFPPGSQYLYSNTGYNLLAILVGRVAGVPFARFTREQIFAPLGMTQTRWRDDYTRVVKGRAIAYEIGSDSAPRQQMPFENVHGNGGLLTTVGDLLKWNENLVTGRVGGAALRDELQRQGVLTTGRRIEYAGGLVVTRYRGVPEVSHSGATAGYRAWLARYPDQRLSVAVLCNAAEARAGTLGHRVADLFLPAAAPAPAPARVAVPRAALAARAGLYRDRRTSEPLRLEFRGGELTLNERPLVPLSPTRFRLGDDATVEFEAAPAGTRAALRMIGSDGDTLAFEPVAEWAPARLADFTGEYRSEEAEVSYTVAVANGKLVLRRRPNARFDLAPEYADAFTTRDGWVVRFSRDRAGRVTGFGLWLDRVRDLQFRRAGP
ncbi:MAG TPA: serine hydrolase domain-containing protein [Longimicrobium sp.]|nr:serine hydrolase domain-containing protein [Longimicrobium sp.]